MWGVSTEDLSNESNEKTNVQKSLLSKKSTKKKQYFAKDEIYFIQGHIWRNKSEIVYKGTIWHYCFPIYPGSIKLDTAIKIGNLGHFGLENLGNSFQKVFIRYVLIYILIQKSIFQWKCALAPYRSISLIYQRFISYITSVFMHSPAFLLLTHPTPGY